jgi:hypothetical protein
VVFREKDAPEIYDKKSRFSVHDFSKTAQPHNFPHLAGLMAQLYHSGNGEGIFGNPATNSYELLAILPQIPTNFWQDCYRLAKVHRCICLHFAVFIGFFFPYLVI